MKKAFAIIAAFLFGAMTGNGHGLYRRALLSEKLQDTTLTFRLIINKMNTELQHVLLSGNSDRDMALLMIVRDLGVIDMEMLEMRRGKNPLLMTKAREMVTTNIHEVFELNKIITRVNPPVNYDPLDKAAGLGKAISSLLKNKTRFGSLDLSIDEEFIKQMIDQHAERLKLMKIILKYSKDREMKAFGESRIQESAIINELRGLGRRYYRPDILRPSGFQQQ
ncbi:MAG: hypothetical protein V4456_01250 [Bacteroidota bacterium]